MRDMSETPEKMTLRYQMMAIARDVLTISAVISVMSAFFWTLARPYVEPFLDLPTKVAEINARLAPISQPHLVEFKGNAILVNGSRFSRGSEMVILYNLKRNASCETQVDLNFINVTTGAKLNAGTIRAVQAPVTDDFAPFILSLVVPPSLPNGRYSYMPRMMPQNCGIYQDYNAVMSEIFEVNG
jgi:hypothetical protein